MTIIHREAIVSYTPAQMFTLVNDVEKYPEFVPWCSGCEILKREGDEIHARMTISKGSLQKSFSTINRIQSNRMIEIRLLEGPFEHLEGFWRFEEIGSNQTKIMFDLEFELMGGVLNFMIGPIFQQIAGSFVDAFVERAQKIYV